MTRRLFLILRLLCAAGLMVWGLRRMHLEDASAFSWSQIHLGWMAAAFAFGGFAVLALAGRWYCFLRVYNLRPRLSEILRLTFFADFFNLYFLGALGADGLRLLLLGRRHRRGAILGSLLMDHIGGLVGAGLIYAVFTRGSGLLPPSVQTAVDILLFAFVFVSFLGLGVLMRPALQHFIGVTRGMKVVTRPLAPMFADRPRHSWLFAGQAVATLGMVSTYAAYWAGACAAGARISLPQMLGVMPIVDLVASLPITISGLGVRENLLVELLGRHHDLPATVALPASLLGFAAVGLWGLIGGIWLLLWRRRTNVEVPLTTASPPDHPTAKVAGS